MFYQTRVIESIERGFDKSKGCVVIKVHPVEEICFNDHAFLDVKGGGASSLMFAPKR